MTASPSLTDEQQVIVELSLASRALVIAAAGTGKTETLIARISHLVQSFDVNTGSGLLILSFTRAAVGEIKDRVARAGGDTAYVGVRTFDSFATRLLADYDADGAWTEADYDGRIRAVTLLLRDCPEELGALEDLEHVFIDEIQDLVGDRAELVEALLEAVGAAVGFTVFGDPAQAIYNHNLKGEARRAGSAPLFEWLRTRFAGELVERTFTSNFRARSALAKAVLRFGPHLLAGDLTNEEIATQLSDLLDVEAPELGDAAALGLFATNPRGWTAVLTRSNGQALMLSRALRDLDIEHVLRRSATDRAVAPWLGRLLRRAGPGNLTRATFDELFAEIDGPDVPTTDVAWSLLRRMAAPSSGRAIDTNRVVDRLRFGYVPDELSPQRSAALTVSTVHRAKGLEFENVVLVWSDPACEEPAEFAEENRIQYVAVTRARDGIYWMCPADVRGDLRTNRNGRWVRHGYKKWHRWGIEVRPSDVDRMSPPGSYGFDGDPVEIQELLTNEVRCGDDVELELLRVATDAQRTLFAVVHRGRRIGVTTEHFGSEGYRDLKVSSSWKIEWPRAITGLSVDGVDTVAGTVASGKRAGLGASGVWLRPRVVGLGDYDRQKGDGR